tara:strand:+ start:5877 stop:7010 length:1134 start_codon:yes stop_codon:yes gene_type:complete
LNHLDEPRREVAAVLGLPFDCLSMDEAVAKIEETIANKQRCFLSTPNLNFAVQARKDPTFYNSVLNSDMVVADGMPIVWVARLLGIPLKQRVAGSSLFEALANPASEKLPRETPLRIFFFGGEGDAAKQAAANIQSISTGIEACGFLNPGMGSIESMSSAEITQQINDSQADFLLVALGAKKGQQWIMHNREKLNVPVISHLGAVINFVAGNIDRAPDSWQNMGLEWLWRIVQEPALFKRYFYDGGYFLYLLLSKVFPLAIYQYVLNKMPRVGPSIQITSDLIDNCLELGLQGSATRQNNRLLKTSCQKALDEPCTILNHVRINCAQLDYFDSAALGTLLLFKASLSEKGQTLSFYNVGTRIERLMSLHMVRDYLLN